MDIEYDLLKAKAKERKHGVSFEEATTALHDPNALVMEDPRAEREQRFILLGLGNLGRLIVVVYTLRHPESIRLISARKASKREVNDYA